MEMRRRSRKDRKAEDREIKNMANNNQYESVLTVRQVAHLLNIHVNTVRRWSDLGVLKTYRIGPRSDRRFRRSDVLTFLPEGNGESEGTTD